MKEQQNGRFEAVWEKLLEYKAESKDPLFTQYLAVFQQKLVTKQHEIDLLGTELEQKHELYLQRMLTQAQTQTAVVTEPVVEAQAVTEDVMKEETQSVTAEEVQSTTVEAVSELTADNVYASYDVPVKPQPQKKTGEFALGTYVFSIVGVFFLLVSFGMLGKYFMNDFFKGLCLFIVATVVYLIGEFVLRKRNDIFHQVFGNLGVAAWYIAIFANCEKLMGIPYFAALIMMLLWGIVVIAIDRWRTKDGWKMAGLSAGAYYFGLVSVLILTIGELDDLWVAIVIGILLLLTKALGKYNMLRAADVGLTVLASIFLIAHTGEPDGYIMLGVFIVSALFIRFYHLFYQLVITLLCVMFVAMSFENDIVITIAVAMMWLFMLLFNYVERFRGAYIYAYNYVLWTCLGFTYLVFAVDAVDMELILSFIMTFLGVGVIVTTVQERFGSCETFRGIACAVFLTFMAFVIPFTYDVTASIVLLVIGVVAIGTGFYMKNKVLRIYGLILSMVVCFKIALFDFADGESLQRMILFFVAGAISLVISGIYVLLEKTVKDSSGE